MALHKIGISVLTIFACISASAFVPQKISVPFDVATSLKSFEPSAVLFFEDLNSFLVACDDTNKKDEPLLFLMDEKGQIESPATQVFAEPQ